MVQRRQPQAATTEQVPQSLPIGPDPAASHGEAEVFEGQPTTAETLETQTKSDQLLVLELTEELRKKVMKSYTDTHFAFLLVAFKAERCIFSSEIVISQYVRARCTALRVVLCPWEVAHDVHSRRPHHTTPFVILYRGHRLTAADSGSTLASTLTLKYTPCI